MTKMVQKVKKEKPPTPFFKEMVEHIDKTWKKKKGVPFYFRPHYFRELKELARIYTPFGVMSLWDLYLIETDEFARKAGWSFEMFLSKIPKLLDIACWKTWRNEYEKKFCGDMPDFVEELAGNLEKKDRPL